MKKILPLIISFILIWMTAAPVSAHAGGVEFYYEGAEGRVLDALRLAETFEQVSDPMAADVIVLNGTIQDAKTIRAAVEGGAGLFLIMGAELEAEAVSALFAEQLQLNPQTEAVSLVENTGAVDFILSEIVWGSAPQVRERTPLRISGVEPLITSYETDEWILARARVGNGRAYVLTAYLDGVNPQIQDWAYFNYLIYQLCAQAGGIEAARFGDYPGSPVPQPKERSLILICLAVLLLVSVVVFIFVRRHSLRHPEALDQLVASPEQFKAHEADTAWEEVGFHRALGGFLLSLMIGLVLFIPLIIYQNMILPSFILPSAQAFGLSGRVTQFFGMAWTFFDMGTSIAFIKFFAQYRVKDPRRAIQYGQIFVWWQALSGALQLALVVIIASTVLPKTDTAIYAWIVIAHALIQLPGFYQVMRHALIAVQRFDFAQILDMALALILPMIVQPIVVLIAVNIGKHSTVFGVSMSGALGLLIAAYVSEALVFILGFIFYRRLGYNTRLLFMAHFDWDALKEAFRFGIFEMFGSISVGIGSALEIVVTQTRLVNYGEIWGNWMMAQNFVFAFSVLHNLFDNLLSSISEAISNTKRVLSQYYAAMAYKYGAMISGFIAAVLLSVADRFILGASGIEFERAATYVIPLTLWGAIQFASWVSDRVQKGSNKTHLFFLLTITEQIIRVFFIFILVRQYQIFGMILAYFIGLSTKGVVGYILNHRLCFPQKIYKWQTLAAPLGAMLLHYAVIRWLMGLIWQGEEWTSVLIFFLAILPSFPLYAFFYALVGGWDKGTLEELEQGAKLAGVMKPLAMVFYWASARGAKLSPLHDRFPVAIREDALVEAKELMKIRVDLVAQPRQLEDT
ncbi:MAG: lipopolysaccharide biosynthesis protein [Anaerolineaceae bacterium]|nr:lipopolysaccharide biosynthesis protein [Anaerolineaceae bacterium]